MARTRSVVVCAGAMVVLAACAGGPSRVSPPRPASETTGLSAVQPDSDATGAVSTVTPDAPGSPQANTIEDLFRGRVAGVEVVTNADGSMSLRIRGAGQDLGLGGSPEPLVIIDGMPSQQGAIEALKGLQPDQIAKIQILKDVSSTAVYGTRGAGGVILVTLRH